MHDLRALVVDDSKVGRLTMLKKLEAMGVKVDLAESGRQALDYLARQRPDVIFMDHMMPDMDGFEVTRRIKASPATRDIPVIVVSGNEDEAFFRDARASGASDAIAKPPANEVLETLLASLPRRVVEAPAEPAPQPKGVEATPAPSVDMAEVRALVERLIGTAVAQLRDDFMAELRRGAADVETLGNRLQAMQQRAAAGMAEFQARVEGLAPESESLRQGFRDLRDELGELRERLSETRLRQLVEEALDNRQPITAARQPVEERESPQPAVGAGLQAEVDRLKGKVKTLSTMVAIGGAALLAVIGVVLLQG